MKRIFCTFIILVALAINVQGAEFYSFTADHPYVPEPYQGFSQDCWLANGSAMLAFSGWGMTTDSTAIYNELFPWAGNRGGVAYEAIQRYQNLYWPGVSVWNTLHYTTYHPIEQLESDINNGWAVGISMRAAPGSHAISVYGYSTDDSTGTLDGLWVSNSWGSQNPPLFEMPVSLVDGSWYATLKYGWMTDLQWQIWREQGLEPEALYVPPPEPPPYIPPDIPDVPTGVPEPTAGWLLGLALMVIVTVKYVSCQRTKAGSAMALPFS